MNDPKRWLDEDGDATLEERELLSAGRQTEMPRGLRKRVWLGVSAGAVGAAGLSATSEAMGAKALNAASGASSSMAGHGALAAIMGSTAGKVVLVVAIAGGAVFGVTKLRSGASSPTTFSEVRPSPHDDIRPVARENSAEVRRSGAPSTPSGGQSAALSTSPIREERASAPSNLVGESGARESVQPATPRAFAPTTRHPSRGSTATSTPALNEAPMPTDRADREEPAEARAASRLREESAAVLSIRKALLGGETALALRMLDRARVDFAGGALTEEREALTVRALAQSGQAVLARQRGEAFLRAFPRSPHASEIRALIGP